MLEKMTIRNVRVLTSSLLPLPPTFEVLFHVISLLCSVFTAVFSQISIQVRTKVSISSQDSRLKLALATSNAAVHSDDDDE